MTTSSTPVKTIDGTRLVLCADGVYRALGPTMWAYRRKRLEAR